MNLKKQLQRYLKKHGMTATQLARKADVPNSCLCDWLSGVSPRNLDNVKKIAEVLAISVDELCFGTDAAVPRVQIHDFCRIINGESLEGVFEIKMKKVTTHDSGK